MIESIQINGFKSIVEMQLELGRVNCFIGANSSVVEGVIVEENSVIAMGVHLGQSTKILDRETNRSVTVASPQARW